MLAFQTVLRVGNTMNQGTLKGNARGLKLTTLKKLPDTKAQKFDIPEDDVIEKMSPSEQARIKRLSKVQSLMDFMAYAVCELEQQHKNGDAGQGGKPAKKGKPGYLQESLGGLSKALERLTSKGDGSDGMVKDRKKDLDQGMLWMRQELKELNIQLPVKVKPKALRKKKERKARRSKPKKLMVDGGDEGGGIGEDGGAMSPIAEGKGECGLSEG